MPLNMDWIRTPLDSLYGQYSGLLVADATDILWALAVVLLILYAVKHGARGGILWFVVDYAVIILIAANILKYWTQPCPLLGGHSVSGFFPAVGEYYANLISSAQWDAFFRRSGLVLAGINQQPLNLQDWAMIPVAWIAQLLVWVLNAVAFGSVALSYVMTGILRLIGPLFVPWLIFPHTSTFFWNMLQSMMQYSFFRIVAQAFVFVVSSAVTTFIDQDLHGDYSLGHMSLLIPKLMVITAFSLVLAFRIDRMTADLFHGGSSATSGAVRSTVSTATAVKGAI